VIIVLNMDFNQRAMSLADEQRWEDSPAGGVARVKLEREAEESGHVTSFVRYAAGASFASHEHPQGEEIFVMQGTFSDEHGDYPTGSYLRNPPGSRHAPFSRDGCTLFVKLNQFASEDQQRVVVTPAQQRWRPGIGGLRVLPLHDHGGQHTALVYWPPRETFQPHRHWGGEEIVVLSGMFRDEHGSYPAGSWLRNPHLSSHTPFVDEETLILVKVGHLPDTGDEVTAA
jgi:anti-sigma factor ChrR (cupin superfamily)